MKLKCASNKPSDPPVLLPGHPLNNRIKSRGHMPCRKQTFSACRKVCNEICITIYRLRGTPFLLVFFIYVRFVVLSWRLSKTKSGESRGASGSIATINLTQKSYQSVIRLPAEQLTKRGDQAARGQEGQEGGRKARRQGRQRIRTPVILNINIIINKFKTQTCLDLKFHKHTHAHLHKSSNSRQTSFRRGGGGARYTVADAAAFAAGVNRIIKRKLSPSRAEK